LEYISTNFPEPGGGDNMLALLAIIFALVFLNLFDAAIMAVTGGTK
jgi:hypothetical protein